MCSITVKHPVLGTPQYLTKLSEMFATEGDCFSMSRRLILHVPQSG
jgi:hypothetical protein